MVDRTGYQRIFTGIIYLSDLHLHSLGKRGRPSVLYPLSFYTDLPKAHHPALSHALRPGPGAVVKPLQYVSQ